MNSEFPGLQPSGPPSASMVSLSLPILLADEDVDTPTTRFALANWILPRVPCIGEEIVIEPRGQRLKVVSVWWDIQGRAMVGLEEVRLDAQGLEALERSAWTVASPEDGPPSGWLAG